MTLTKEFVSFEIKKMPDETGIFEGYGSVFGNVDGGRDIVLRGAFSDSIARWKSKSRMPKLLWQHDTREPLGVWTDMAEDDHGLFMKGKLTKGVRRADEAHALMKDGAIDGLSIGYRTLEDDYDRELNVRKLKKLDLMEVSIVTLPMNDAATVTGVKAAETVKTIRQFEDFLRDVGGFSHAAAKAIAAGGFKSSEPRDEDGAMTDLLTAARSARRKS